MSPARRFSDDEVARLYREGVPVKQMAERFGVREGTVNDRLYRMRQDGWNLPHRTRRPVKVAVVTEMDPVVRARIEFRQALYVPGKRVVARIWRLPSKALPPPGTWGTVQSVDSGGMVHVVWDNGIVAGVTMQDAIGIELDRSSPGR